jgi:hypothetical protein
MLDEKETIHTTEEPTIEKPTEKKKNILDFGKKIWAGIEEKAKDVAADVKDYTDKKKEEHKELEAFKKAYSESTYVYEIQGAIEKNGRTKTICAFRIKEKNELEIWENEDHIGDVFSNSILLNLLDRSKIQILTVETKEIRHHKLLIDGIEKTIQCFVASYEKYDEKKVQGPQVVHNEVHQNVNIGGNNTGEVSLNSNIQVKFDQLERDIRALKFSPFNTKGKKQQEEALTIIGPVKNCIINGKKEDPLVKKFLDLLLAIAPTLATVFLAI